MNLRTAATTRALALAITLALALTVGLAAGAGAAEGPRYTRTVENYVVPDVTLIDQDGRHVRLRELTEGGGPVLVDFIYGTCTTICPVLSAGFSSLQRRLQAEGKSARLISVSIDPEYDTPEITKAYLARYKALPGWEFLTGTREQIDLVMRAFDAYVSNKMSHYPVTFLRQPDGKWVRIYGLIGTRELLAEYGKVAAP